MTNEEAIKILSMELSHTKSHMEIEGKATEYYNEMSQIAEALRIGIDAIKNSPIIRCPDCRFYHKRWHSDKRLKEKGYWCCWCDCHDDWVGGTNGFCSLAERQGEEE